MESRHVFLLAFQQILIFQTNSNHRVKINRVSNWYILYSYKIEKVCEKITSFVNSSFEADVMYLKK